MVGKRASDRVPALIACALRTEAELLAAEPVLDGIDVIATGLGPERTRRNLRRILPELVPRWLVFTGAAGGVDPVLSLGEVVFPAAWQLEGGDLYSADPRAVESLQRLGWRVEGIGWTATLPVPDWESKQALFQRSGARVCDMESAAALETALQLGVPAVVLKVVTDPAIPDSPPFTPGAFLRVLPQVIPPLAEQLARLLDDLTAAG